VTPQPDLQQHLRTAFAYDPDAGTLTNITTGRQVGTVTGDQHPVITFKFGHKTLHLQAARLIWLRETGNLPKVRTIIHVDGDRTNLRASNLRCFPTGAPSGGKAPTLGYRKQGNRVYAKVYFLNKAHHVGSFETQEAAEAAAEVFSDRLIAKFVAKAQSLTPQPPP
jgi:hypothetical protein